MAVIRSKYFSPRALRIGQNEIVALACMRNELVRLPYFLEYYRRLGVNRFLMVDNASTDGTREYLEEQPDVEYFWTRSSYRGSSAGRLWLQEVADTYLTNQWAVTVDVDELLTFPGAEEIDLRQLCSYLDDNHQRGLFCILLDMYSDRPLSQTHYAQGDDFLDACHFFETDSYVLAPGANPPFIGVFGGPRHRIFQRGGAEGRGPMMKKIPLVKWGDDFSYIFSTHSTRHIPLSDVTGALLHFKFFETFEFDVVSEAQRGDRRQQGDYEAYKDGVSGDSCFYGRQSVDYRGPVDLVRLGVMCASERYANFVGSHFRSMGAVDYDVPSLLPSPIAAEGSLSLRSVAAIWPMVNNPGIGEYFGSLERPPRERRADLIEDLARDITVLDVADDHVLMRIDETVQHRWQRGNLGMRVYVGRQLVSDVMVDGSDDDLQVDVDSLESAACRLSVDIAGAARRLPGASQSVNISVYLYDSEDGTASTPGVESAVDDTSVGEVLIYHRGWFVERWTAVPERGVHGAIGRFDDGLLRGWVYDFERDTFDVPVCVYVNGRLVRHVWPDRRRADVEMFRVDGSTARGRGFLVDVPIGYFDVSGDVGVQIDAVVAGRNLALKHSPLVLPIGVRQATWDLSSETWQFGASRPEVETPIARMSVENGTHHSNGTKVADGSQRNGLMSWLKALR